jgi:E2 binding domain
VEISLRNDGLIRDGLFMNLLTVSRRIQIRKSHLMQTDYDSQVKKPSIRSSTKSLYIQSVPQLEESTRRNLQKPLKHLLNDGEQIVVTDTNLPFELRFIIKFQERS